MRHLHGHPGHHGPFGEDHGPGPFTPGGRPGQRRRWDPLSRFVASRFQRRIFWGFGVAIVVTGLTISAIAHLTSGSFSSTRSRDMQRMQSLVSDQFAERWGDEAAVVALASRYAEVLDAEVTVRGADGAVRAHAGAACSQQHFRPSAQVMRGETALGEVSACSDRWSIPTWKFIGMPMVALFVLWMASGFIAMRLARPITLVTRIAEQLGNGDLTARAELGCHLSGEEEVLARSINGMAARIEKQMGDQRELLAAVSHELRTPLGHQRLLLEMARDAGTAQPKLIDELERELFELDALVADLLASSRLSFQALSLRDLEVAPVAGRALERAGLPPEKLVLGQGVEATATVKADPTLLARALANLLANARQHAGAVEALRVERAVDGAMTFVVEDCGPGFEPGETERLFDAFNHKPKDAEGVAGSLGLGLVLVGRIARAHGGLPFARNREGGGALVGFTLPSRSAAA